MPTPTRHYWGVSMNYNWKWYSSWPANSAVIEPNPSRLFEGHIDAAFARGICWHLDMPCPRRPSFPSWSWSGWIGPLADAAWGFLSQFGDSEVKIWLQRANREHERLSESVVDSISKCGPTYTGYTPILRIEAWVIDISLTYLADGHSGESVHYPGMYPEPRYFVSIGAPAAGGIRGTLRWPVVFSVQVEEGDELHEELCQETLTCVLLSEALDFGLVVRRRAQGIMERIGHSSVYPSFLDLEDPFDITEDYGIHERVSLFDILPRARRTILLG